MHDQSESIADSIAAYEGALRAKGLPDIPFHASPLMNGKDQYSGLDLRTRKMMLGSFRVFFRHMPVKYHTFAYATKQFASLDKLAGAMRRDIVNFLFDNLAELQSYDMVKVYYDNGQRSIAESLHRAVEYALSKDAVVYRLAQPSEYRLPQAGSHAIKYHLDVLWWATRIPTIPPRGPSERERPSNVASRNLLPRSIALFLSRQKTANVIWRLRANEESHGRAPARTARPPKSQRIRVRRKGSPNRPIARLPEC